MRATPWSVVAAITLLVPAACGGTIFDPEVRDAAGDTDGRPESGEYAQAVDLLGAFVSGETADSIDLAFMVARLPDGVAYPPEGGVEYEASISVFKPQGRLGWWVSAQYDGLDGWRFTLDVAGPSNTTELEGWTDGTNRTVAVRLPREAIGGPLRNDTLSIDMLTADTAPLVAYLPYDVAYGPGRPYRFTQGDAAKPAGTTTTAPPPPSGTTSKSTSSAPPTGTGSTSPTATDSTTASGTDGVMTTTKGKGGIPAPPAALVLAFLALALALWTRRRLPPGR